MSDASPTPLGPCEPWATVDDLPEGCPCIEAAGSGDDGQPTPERLEELLAEATDICWALLGRQPIGLCERTIHPCLRIDRWRQRLGARWVEPSRLNYGAIGCPNEGVRLDGPVNDVTEVLIDGVALDPSEYVLVDGIWLVRVEGSWPSGSMTDPDAFAITYTQGVPVPPLVRDATIEIANLLWDDRCGRLTCLPSRRVSSMSVAGTSYSYPQPQSDAERVAEVATDLAITWRAIGQFNPRQQPTPSVLYDPDEPYRNSTIRQF